MKNDNNIVIKDCGVFSPIGNDIPSICNHLKNGVSGIEKLDAPIFHNLTTHHAGVVRNFCPKKFSNTTLNGIKSISFVLNAIDAIIEKNEFDFSQKRVGVFLETEPPVIDFNEELSFLKKNFDIANNCWNQDLEIYKTEYCGLKPEKILNEIFNVFNFRGPAFLHFGTCAASSQALGEAAQLLKLGVIDYAFVGGVSCRVDPLSFMRLIRIGALAPTSGNAKDLSRPFDKKRCGFTMSEGCVIFLLEKENRNSAHYKNAPLGYIKGYGASLDGFSITDPSQDGMELSMLRALKDAKLSTEDIDYINAHGTSTIKNDLCETNAIKQVFKKNIPPISSTKSMHGHLISAAGAMEALVSLIAINNNFIPPTINLKDPDPLCDLNYTPNFSVTKKLRTVLSNSFGLGGQNSTLILSKYE